MDRLSDRLPALETILWMLASAVAFIVFLMFAPGFFAAPTPTLTRTPTLTPPPRATGTPRPTLTPFPTVPNIPLPPPVAARTPLPMPSLAANAEVFAFNADPKKSGWLTNKETGIHWGDRNLHVGYYREQTFQTLLYFDASEIIPGSKILSARVELVGLNRNNLGSNGGWTLRLLPADLLRDWTTRPNQNFRDAQPVADVGAVLKPEDLAEDRLNQFVFAPAQLARLEEMVTKTGQIAFRLDGPASGGDSLFTWDAGDRDPKIGLHPVLRVIAVPDQYLFITQTPTPQNVITAAAFVVQGTEFAKQYGTPTPFPRKYATALPLMPITPQPTPANVETVSAQVMYATAVAMTTGTFTPTPKHWITTTPIPVVIPAQNLTPSPTATPTPTPLTIVQAAKRTVPADLYNKIVFQRGARHAPSIWVMDPDGKNLGLVTDRALYETVVARDVVSPDGAFALFNSADHNRPDTLQIWRSDLRQPSLPAQPLTALRAGIAFAPAWSPDGTKVAYVSTETGRHELWILDANTRATRQMTFSTDWFWNQYPSWSPDGKQIVFSSDRGHGGSFTELWLMNADGNVIRKLGDGSQDAWGAVWIKWRQ